MALIKPTTDYTDKDFDSLRARLINLVGSAFPDWTDFNVANFGNILLELMAFTGDVLVYYQDNQAKESRIGTAQLRASLLGLSKLIGFTPTGASAATTDLTFSLAAPAAGTVTINVGDTFRTREVDNPAVFQATTQTVIPAGTTTVIFGVEHSEPALDVFTSTDLSNQEYQLTSTPFLDGSAIITANDGAYTLVDNFLSSTSTDRHFTLKVDEFDRAKVRFGDGVNGTIPAGTITINYKTGGGSAGEVDVGTITRPDTAYTDSFGTAVSVSVTNQNKASGGEDRQTTEGIRVAAPQSLRTLNRTVAREDYETHATAVAGVARAVMLTSNEKVGVLENQGDLHIVPTGGGVPSDALKAAVLTSVTVTHPNTLTFQVTVKDPTYTTVDVEAQVFLTEGATAATVDALIRTALTEYFQLTNADGSPNSNVDFGFKLGGEIALSDVRNIVRDTAGVRKISTASAAFKLNNQADDLPLDTFTFPILGTVTLINAETGAVLA